MSDVIWVLGCITLIVLCAAALFAMTVG